MTSVKLQIIPGIKAPRMGYMMEADRPYEDYSLILLTTSDGKKDYQGGTFVSNSLLPLSKKFMEQLRKMALDKMAVAIAKEKEDAKAGNKQVRTDAVSK